MSILLIFFLTTGVQAHKPIETSGPATRNEPIVIENHQISWVAYNQLIEVDKVDYYRLENVKAGEKIYASMLIPKIERLKNFTPVIALVGPGLDDNFNGLEREKIENRLDIKAEEGIIVKKADRKQSEIFFEPFTQTRYWERQELNIEAPVNGEYYVTVFDTENRADKYVLAIGEEEEWGFRDLVRMPLIWWNVRMFMEKQLSTYIITGILFMLLLLLVRYIIKR